MHRITRSLLLLATIPLAAPTSAVSRATLSATDLALTANLGAKTLVAMRGSDTVKVYDIAVGADNHPTPTGTFAIR